MISLKFLFVFVILKVTWGYQRQLNSTINPGCTSISCENGHNISMVYISAYGTEDVMHYVWDYSLKPSILMAVTNLDSVLQIDCENYCNNEEGSITFSEGTLYNFSVVFNKVIEYNDENDDGKLNESNSSVNIFNTQFFKWKLQSFVESEYLAQVYVTGEGYENANITKRGLISLSFKAFSKHGYDDVLPHLMHTANSSQLELQLENLQLDKKFNCSRFAVEVLIISPQGTNRTVEVNSIRNLDDEFAPGVFEIVELITSKQIVSNKGAYIQYRPISYTSKERIIANSTDVNRSFNSNLTNAWDDIKQSVAYAFYEQNLNNTFISGINISFGTSGDGFYKNRNFTTWSFTVGYGKPPNQKFSLVVIVVICIALGTPFLVMVLGITYFCCKHYIEEKRNRL